jgi:plastocyanin
MAWARVISTIRQKEVEATVPKSLKILALASVVVLAFAACGGSDDPKPADNGNDEGTTGGGPEVEVSLVASDFEYDTTEISVAAGSTVNLTFENTGGAAHSFTSDDLDVEAEAAAGSTRTTAFDVPDPGTFEYHCKFHPDQMQGEITVTG